jgi:hypothetical protein
MLGLLRRLIPGARLEVASNAVPSMEASARDVPVALADLDRLVDELVGAAEIAEHAQHCTEVSVPA